jgi:hypothetical protein
VFSPSPQGRSIMFGKYGRILVENGLVPVYRRATNFPPIK